MPHSLQNTENTRFSDTALLVTGKSVYGDDSDRSAAFSGTSGIRFNARLEIKPRICIQLNRKSAQYKRLRQRLEKPSERGNRRNSGKTQLTLPAGARLEWPRHCLLISLKGERYVAYMCTRCALDTTARRARSAATVTSSGSDDDEDGDDGGGGDSGGGGGGNIPSGSGGCGDGGTTDTPRLSSAILVRCHGVTVVAANHPRRRYHRRHHY